MAFCVSMLVIFAALASGLRHRASFDFQALGSRLTEVQADYIAQGGLELLTAWHHRFGEAASPPRVPFPTPVQDPDSPTVFPNRAHKWIDHSGVTRFRYRLEWDFRRIEAEAGQVGPTIGEALIQVNPGTRDVTVTGARFVASGVRPGDILELVDVSRSNPIVDPFGHRDTVYDRVGALITGAGNDLTFPPGMGFRTRGLRAGSYLRLDDVTYGIAGRWFRIAAVRSDNQLTLESPDPDGHGIFTTGLHLNIRIYPVRRFPIQSVQGESTVRIQTTLDPDGLGPLRDTLTAPAGWPWHTGIRVVRPVMSLVAGVTLRSDDNANHYIARADHRRIGLSLQAVDNNGPGARSLHLRNVADSGVRKAGFPSFAVMSLVVAGRSQLHLVRTDIDRAGQRGQAQLIESLANDRDPVVSPRGRIVFCRQISGRYQVCDMDHSGTDVRILTQETASCASPVVTPDGAFIFYAVPTRNEIRYIPYGRALGPGWVIPASATLIAPGASYERNMALPNGDGAIAPTGHDRLALSPDGRILAFSATRQNRRCLYLFNLVPDPAGGFLAPGPELYGLRSEAVTVTAPSRITVPNSTFQTASSSDGPAAPGWILELRDANNGGITRRFDVTGVPAATQLDVASLNPDGLGPLLAGTHTHIRVFPSGQAVDLPPGPPRWVELRGARLATRGVQVGDQLELVDSTLPETGPRRILRRFDIQALRPASPQDEWQVRLVSVDPEPLGAGIAGDLQPGEHPDFRIVRPPGPVYRYSSANYDMDDPSFSRDGQTLLAINRRPLPAATQPARWIQGEVVAMPVYRTNLVDRFNLALPGGVTVNVTAVGPPPPPPQPALVWLSGMAQTFRDRGVVPRNPLAGDPSPALRLELADVNNGSVLRQFRITGVLYSGTGVELRIEDRDPDGPGGLPPLVTGDHRQIRIFPEHDGLSARSPSSEFPSRQLQEGTSSDNQGTLVELTNNLESERFPRWSARGAVEPAGNVFDDLYYLSNNGGWNLRRAVCQVRGPGAPAAPVPDPATGLGTPQDETTGYSFAQRPWAWSLRD